MKHSKAVRAVNPRRPFHTDEGLPAFGLTGKIAHHWADNTVEPLSGPVAYWTRATQRLRALVK